MDGDRQRHASARELLRVDQHLLRVQRLGDGRCEVATSNPSEVIEIARVDWVDPRASHLRDMMEEEMSSLYGSTVQDYPPDVARSLSAAFAVEPETIVATLLVVSGETPVGHSGLRRYPPDAPTLDVLEVKKVFVRHSYRGRGISRILMENLEVVARELGSTRLVLQTGTLQPAAIALYESLGYSVTAPYPPFEAMPNALCYEKTL